MVIAANDYVAGIIGFTSAPSAPVSEWSLAGGLLIHSDLPEQSSELLSSPARIYEVREGATVEIPVLRSRPGRGAVVVHFEISAVSTHATLPEYRFKVDRGTLNFGPVSNIMFIILYFIF